MKSYFKIMFHIVLVMSMLGCIGASMWGLFTVLILVDILLFTICVTVTFEPKFIIRDEYIICAAIWYNDGIKHPEQPKNIHAGIVFAGRRHNNVYTLLHQAYPNNEYLKEHTQGFLTSKDRFVTREVGYNIAIACGQVKSKDFDSGILINFVTKSGEVAPKYYPTLISEDLY